MDKDKEATVKDSWMQNMENVIKKWEKHGPSQSQRNSTGTEPTSTISSNNGVATNNYVSSNFDPSQHRRKKKKRTTNRRNRPEDSEFWYAKDGPDIPKKFQLIPPVLEAPKQRILINCKRCQVLHQGNTILPTTAGKGLLNLLDLVEHNRGRSMATLFPRYREFLFPSIKLENVTESTRIRNLIKEETQKYDEKDENKASILSKIKLLFEQITADISNTWLRITAWVLLKLFKQSFGGICYHAEDLELIQAASKKQIPIIYLPLHKSHLDYIILTLILYCNDIKVPYVAVGDNLGRISLIGYSLHKLGAFFIRRNNRSNGYNDNKLYKAVLQEYIEQLLRTGQSLEVFIEGTKTGLSVIPKTGILSVIVNAVQEGIVPDVIIVPVNICYEKGTEKQPESIWQCVRGACEMMHVYCGRIHVAFGQPFTLHDFLERENQFQNRAGITSSGNFEGFEVKSSSLRPTKALGYHIIYDCIMSSVCLCTHMVSFLLLTKHRGGVTMAVLEDSFKILKEKLETHRRYLGFSGNTYDIVKYAIKLVLQQKLVTLQRDENTDNPSTIHLSKDLVNVMTLSYYANQVKPIFAGRAVK